VHILEGRHRYRLFLRTPVEVADGKEYVAEGIYAQKAIDEIGDSDQGKNGCPLESSCEHIVRKAWTNVSFDAGRPTGIDCAPPRETLSGEAFVPGHADRARYLHGYHHRAGG
jgi:hypothetical protein